MLKAFRKAAQGRLACLLVLLVATLTIVSTPEANAQVLYGSIVGTVSDSSGGVIPGATVTVTNLGTSQSASSTTNETGSYTFSNLLAGTYDLTVQVNPPGGVPASAGRL